MQRQLWRLAWITARRAPPSPRAYRHSRGGLVRGEDIVAHIHYLYRQFLNKLIQLHTICSGVYGFRRRVQSGWCCQTRKRETQGDLHRRERFTKEYIPIVVFANALRCTCVLIAHALCQLSNRLLLQGAGCKSVKSTNINISSGGSISSSNSGEQRELQGWLPMYYVPKCIREYCALINIKR